MDLVFWLFAHLLVIPLTNGLVLISRIFWGNFGIAIIVFTLVMRAATWPLTRQQLRTTRAMQTAQPRIQEIQKKYKDPKRRSEETMKVYREVGFSPMGCVWPMLVQFPIWIALYQSIQFTLSSTPERLLDLSQRLYPWAYLRTAVPLENQFLWLDLSQPDAFIMPLLVGLSMWVQQKMTTPTTAVDPQQQQINNMTQLMFPFMFAFLTLQFPSGLALYWVATNVVGITMQYFYMGRRMDWRQIFSVNPTPAPVPAAKQAGGNQANEDTSDEEDDEGEASPVVGEAQRRRRRRRRGRQRRR
ncbi:MAG: YidC/Oxa1 family membrane protein insertase [Dehalococcoidia bacterium]